MTGLIVAYVIGFVAMVVGVRAGYVMGKRRVTNDLIRLLTTGLDTVDAGGGGGSVSAPNQWPTITVPIDAEADEVVRRVAELERVRQEGEVDVDHGDPETEV